MRFASVLATAAIVVTLGADTGLAQALKKAVPAEFPPASYTGRQYVDSKGCVFIRAGVDGAVTWVPRVTRSRQQVCGFKPTLSATALARATAPRATAPAAAVPKPAAKPKAATPVAAVRSTAVPAPAPAPAPRKPAKPAYVSAPPPAPAPGVTAAPPKVATAPVPSPKRVAGTSTCEGLSPISRQYLRSDRYPVRCGPQSAPPVTLRATASPGATIYRPAAVAPTGTAGNYRSGTRAPYSALQRVAPRHVYAQQKISTAGVYVPPGYAPVWDDDRLNPRRAHQTLAGKAQMELIWTRTVPRKLIVRDTGQVVTRAYPGLVYPYTSYAEQKAATAAQATAQATVSSKGVAPAAVAVSRAAPAPPAALSPAPAKAVRKAAPASHRYVQLGAFVDPDSAKRVAQQIANSGLPARMGGVKRDGKRYTLVLAGPFGNQAQLEDGLRRVREMGYTRAVLRR